MQILLNNKLKVKIFYIAIGARLTMTRNRFFILYNITL